MAGDWFICPKWRIRFQIIFSSLWPSGATWWQRSESISAQVMVCCLMASWHYMNQFWFLIVEVLFWCGCGVSWQARQDVGLQALYFVRQWWRNTETQGTRERAPSTPGVGFYSYLKLDFVFRKLHVSSCDDHMLFMTWPVWSMYKEYIIWV